MRKLGLIAGGGSLPVEIAEHCQRSARPLFVIRLKGFAGAGLERYAGAPSTDVLSYAPNRVTDLPSERDRLQRPVVYHLFGRLSASPTYVISDEDLLEFICALQSEHLVPEKLFYELEHNHLLFIGSNFTNWLARLFLRMAKRQRLSDPRDVGEVMADGHTSHDDRLVAFLQQVSVRTRIYEGAEPFVEELYRRWQARRRPGNTRATTVGCPSRRWPPQPATACAR